jgi:hypothetical protein
MFYVKYSAKSIPIMQICIGNSLIHAYSSFVILVLTSKYSLLTNINLNFI